MKTTQYTVRNIPEPINNYLRKRVRISGKSLNQVIIDELSSNIAPISKPIGDSLDWFIGSGIDNKTLQALAHDEIQQKELAKKELLNAS